MDYYDNAEQLESEMDMLWTTHESFANDRGFFSDSTLKAYSYDVSIWPYDDSIDVELGISAGNGHIYVYSKDEIVSLHEALTTLVDKIKEAEKEVEKREQERSQETPAEL